jgi:AraC-like DNA-binding protein
MVKTTAAPTSTPICEPDSALAKKQADNDSAAVPATAKPALPAKDSGLTKFAKTDSLDLDSLVNTITKDSLHALISASQPAKEVSGIRPAAALKQHKGKKVLTLVARYGLHLVILLISAVLIGTLVLFLINRGEKRRFMTTTRLSVMDTEVQLACKHIEKRYQDPTLTIETLCRDLVTGEAFLQAMFERELGIRVEEFIAQVRINQSMHLIRTKPLSTPDEVAAATGFASSEDFLKEFQKIVGATFEHYVNTRKASRS